MKKYMIYLFLFITIAIYCEGVLPEGEGTIESPFLIETLDNLRYISENSDMWSGYSYLQTADIDASASINWNLGKGFKPLGEAYHQEVWGGDGFYTVYYYTPFDSTYDGGGYSISNLYINHLVPDYSWGPESTYIGFVSNQFSGSLKNINLIDITVNGGDHVGGLVSYTEGYINNCSVTGTVTGYSLNIGGLVGESNDALIVNSNFSGDVTGYKYTSSLIGQCTNSIIRNCNTSGSVTAHFSCSGLVTYISDGNEIEDCAVDVQIYCDSDNDYDDKSAGFFDALHNLIPSSSFSAGSNTSDYSTVSNTFYSSNSSVNNVHRNVFGKLSEVEFQQWLDNDKVFDPDDYFSYSNGSYIINTEEEFKKLNYFYSRSDLEFILGSDITLGEESTSPILMFNSNLDGNGHTISGLDIDAGQSQLGLFGLIEIDGVIENLNLDNFQIWGDDFIGCMAGICKGEITDCQVDGSLYCGDSCGLLVGYLDYYGKIIRSTTYGNIDGHDKLGGIVGEVTIWRSQLDISSCNSYVSIEGNDYLGGIIGRYGVALDCFFDGEIEGNDYVGGIIGNSINTGSITSGCESHGIIQGNATVGGISGNAHVINCMSDANVNGEDKVGGISGESRFIESSYYLGEVSGNTYVGGIVGLISLSGDSRVEKCFSDGVIKGRVYVGGIAGYASEPIYNLYSAIKDCYSKSVITFYNPSTLSYQYIGGIIGKAESVIIDNCYTTSLIILATGTEIGGFSGEVNNILGTRNSFWSSELAGIDYSASGTDITINQLQTQSTFTDSGWDFETTWFLDSEQNDGYPIIRNVHYTDNTDDELNQTVEQVTSMKSAYPNPFNPETNIDFYVEKDDVASLVIYNLKGQVVKKFSSFGHGQHKVVWNGKNDDNRLVSSGIYLYRLKGKTSNIMKKVTLMK